MKNIISKHQGTAGKKDHFIGVLELLIKLHMATDSELTDTALHLLCLMFKTKDKPRMNYREWLSRILHNLTLLVQSLIPRTIDDPRLNEPLDTTNTALFEFVFDRTDGAGAQLTFKDLRL